MEAICYSDNRSYQRKLLADTRRWSTQPSAIRRGSHRIEVVESGSLEELNDRVESNGKKDTLIVTAIRDFDDINQFPLNKDKCDIIFYLLSSKKNQQRILLSLKNRKNRYTVGNNLSFALTKYLIHNNIRRKFVFNRLERECELIQHFELRYREFKKLGYIQSRQDSIKTKLDIDYSDRYSYPIGIYQKKKPEMVRTGRIVFSFGEELDVMVNLIEKIVADTRDKTLENNISYPEGFNHPFDLLASFGVGFQRYYCNLVRKNLSKAELSRIIVKPEFRGIGLGEYLVDILVGEAVDSNISVLFLACLKEHEKFYTRSGFSQIEGLYCESFVNIGKPAIAMHKVL